MFNYSTMLRYLAAAYSLFRMIITWNDGVKAATALFYNFLQILH